MLFSNDQYAIIDLRPYTPGSSIVTSSADGFNIDGSLRTIIRQVPPNTTITFVPEISEIALSEGEILINKRITINGGSDESRVTIDANEKTRIFNVTSSTTINNLILKNGLGTGLGGGAIFITNSSLLSALNCIFINNSSHFGGAVFLSSNCILNTNRCQFIGNNAVSGGAVRVDHPLAIFTASNCTFLDNVASIQGGGIYSEGTFDAANSSFINNSISGNGSGGAI